MIISPSTQLVLRFLIKGQEQHVSALKSHHQVVTKYHSENWNVVTFSDTLIYYDTGRLNQTLRIFINTSI